MKGFNNCGRDGEGDASYFIASEVRRDNTTGGETCAHVATCSVRRSKEEQVNPPTRCSSVYTQKLKVIC